MAHVRDGSLAPRLAYAGTLEMDELVDGFNVMISRLRAGEIAEREARRLHDERAEHLAVVGELAAGLAHEIRNPVSSVKAAVEVLERGLDQRDTRRDVLRDIAGELGHVEQIVRDLLQYARPHPPTFAAVDLNRVAGDSCRLLEPQAAALGIDLELRLAPSLPQVRADRSQVQHVVMNLVLNAFQALERSRGERRVTVATRLVGDEVRCAVEDTGPGVPAERATSIFKPFFTTKGRGTGLGLSISRRTIEQQGGRLVLDNPGASGASFSFGLPVAPLLDEEPEACREIAS
jgi:signal transduction histidine kinase